MSILIKGMDMPEKGTQRVIYMAIDSTGLVELLDPDTNTLIEEYYAVPVPPYGRLINADALRKRIAATYYSQDEKNKAPVEDIPWMNGCNTKVNEVCRMIDDAPTIIPVEEVEGMKCKYGITRCLCQSCKSNAAYENCICGYCINCFECEGAGEAIHDISFCTGHKKIEDDE